MVCVRQRVLWTALAGMLTALPLAAGTIEGRMRNTETPSNFVISIEDIGGDFPAPEQPAVMEQIELRFVPHVLVVLVGSTVEFPNRDPLSHNVFSISEAKRFNFGLYARGASRRLRFDKLGVVELLCSVHLEMSAYIVVVKNPYFARTGPAGTYRLVGVPPGRHRVRCWHERFPVQERTVEVPETGPVTVDFVVGG